MLKKVSELTGAHRVRFKRLVARSAAAILSGARARAAVDTGFLRQHMMVDTEDDGMTALIGADETVHYAKYVEFGTGPAVGHAPYFPRLHPPSALRDWARRHGMEGAEFVIARRIHERGLPPRPFLHPAFEEQRGPFLKEAADIVRQAGI